MEIQSVESNVIDDKMFRGELEYDLTDQGLVVETNKRNFKIEFEESRFRPSDVPILLSNINKIKELGFEPKRSLHDIIQDQINYYLNYENRNESILSPLSEFRYQSIGRFAFFILFIILVEFFLSIVGTLPVAIGSSAKSISTSRCPAS